MRIALKLLPALFAVSLWQLAAWSDPELAFLFSSPQEIWRVAQVDFLLPEFWQGIFITLSESLVGLFIGMICGVVLGLLCWSFPTLGDLLKPYLGFFSAIPLFAVAPMFIVWFGTGFQAKCVMVALGVFFLFVKQVGEGAQACSQQFSVFYEVMGCSRFQLIYYVIVPGTMRWIVSALELGFGVAFLGAFIGEFVSSESGLGHYILRSASLYDTARVLIGVSILSTLVLFLQWLSRYAFKSLSGLAEDPL